MQGVGQVSLHMQGVGPVRQVSSPFQKKKIEACLHSLQDPTAPAPAPLATYCPARTWARWGHYMRALTPTVFGPSGQTLFSHPPHRPPTCAHTHAHRRADAQARTHAHCFQRRRGLSPRRRCRSQSRTAIPFPHPLPLSAAVCSCVCVLRSAPQGRRHSLSRRNSWAPAQSRRRAPGMHATESAPEVVLVTLGYLLVDDRLPDSFDSVLDVEAVAVCLGLFSAPHTCCW